MKALRQIFVSSLILAISQIAVAEKTRVYTWKDKDGVRHYSQTPPTQNHYEEREVRQQATSSDAEAINANPDESVSCRLAKKNFESLNQADVRLMIDRDGDGTREAMNEQEIAEARKIAQDQIQSFCVKAPTADANSESGLK